MKYATAVERHHSSALESDSLSDFIRRTSNPHYNRSASRPTVALAHEQDREREKNLTRDLALRVLTSGYKTQAEKLHPDKGGSTEAMARLNQVRRVLLRAIEQAPW